MQKKKNGETQKIIINKKCNEKMLLGKKCSQISTSFKILGTYTYYFSKEKSS